MALDLLSLDNDINSESTELNPDNDPSGLNGVNEHGVVHSQTLLKYNLFSRIVAIRIIRLIY